MNTRRERFPARFIYVTAFMMSTEKNKERLLQDSDAQSNNPTLPAFLARPSDSPVFAVAQARSLSEEEGDFYV